MGYLLHGEVAYLLEGLTAPLGKTLVFSTLLGILTAGWMVLMHYRHAARKINR